MGQWDCQGIYWWMFILLNNVGLTDGRKEL